MLKLIGLFDNKTKSLVPMLDKYVPCDNSQTVKILNWEPMPWEQAFIGHAKSLRQLRTKPNYGESSSYRGSGYIAQHCIAELVKKGYSVRTSLRSENRDRSEAGNSKEVDANNLEFCKLDLLKDEGWDEAVAGCTYVLHVASPLTDKAPDDENEIIQPAKEVFLNAKSSIKNNIKICHDFIIFSCGLETKKKYDESHWTDQVRILVRTIRVRQLLKKRCGLTWTVL